MATDVTPPSSTICQPPIFTQECIFFILILEKNAPLYPPPLMWHHQAGPFARSSQQGIPPPISTQGCLSFSSSFWRKIHPCRYEMQIRLGLKSSSCGSKVKIKIQVHNLQILTSGIPSTVHNLPMPCCSELRGRPVNVCEFVCISLILCHIFLRYCLCISLIMKHVFLWFIICECAAGRNQEVGQCMWVGLYFFDCVSCISQILLCVFFWLWNTYLSGL